MTEDLAVEIRYENGSTMLLECLGPETVLGMVRDALHSENVHEIVVRGSAKAIEEWTAAAVSAQ